MKFKPPRKLLIISKYLIVFAFITIYACENKKHTQNNFNFEFMEKQIDFAYALTSNFIQYYDAKCAAKMMDRNIYGSIIDYELNIRIFIEQINKLIQRSESESHVELNLVLQELSEQYNADMASFSKEESMFIKSKKTFNSEQEFKLHLLCIKLQMINSFNQYMIEMLPKSELLEN